MTEVEIEKYLKKEAYVKQALSKMEQVDRKDVSGKVDPFHMPWEAIIAYNAISDYGHKKYGNRETWKHSEAKEGIRRYLAAMVRHAWKIVCGEYVDPESGLPHVYACVWNACAAVYHYERLKSP